MQLVQSQLSLEIWPHVEDDHYARLDSACLEVVPLIVGQTLIDPATGQGFIAAYAGAAMMDNPVRSWDAYARPLRFTLSVANWTIPDDPRTLALAAWTEATWPGLVTTDKGGDPPPTDARPGIYYRPLSDGVPNEAMSTLGADFFDEQIAVHVVAPSPQVRVDWTARLAQTLRRASVPYDGVFLTPRVQTVSMAADPMRDGQLRIIVTYRVLAAWMAPQTALRQVTLAGGGVTIVVPNPNP
jgi:hypothetical protein